MSDLDTNDLDDLSDIYQALGNTTRLKILLQLSSNKPVSELKSELDISRSGLQKHIERLIKSELVYRPQKRSENTYELTPLGKRYIQLIHEDQDRSLTVVEMLQPEREKLEQENSEARETLEEAGVDLTEFEQKLKLEAWENIWEEAEGELELE